MTAEPHSPRPGPVLVLNAGSSSLKYQVVEADGATVAVRGLVERIEPGGFPGAFGEVRERLEAEGVVADRLAAVAHRVVHGGPDLRGPVTVDDAVLAAIEDAGRWAPLHQPSAVAGIRGAQDAYPGARQVAVFDTDFFADLPAAAATYALDRELTARERIRRYGMHGISHEYVVHAAAAYLGRDIDELDQVVLHLGSGASASAVRGRRPLDTSMGLTPLEGLVMGTRAGDLDPGLLLHLLRDGGLDLDGLEDLLHHRAGLEGLCGRHDFRELLAAVDAGDEAARTAYAVYLHRLRRYVGAFLAVLGGADVLVFTGGVGEHSARLRRDCLSGLEALGLTVDGRRNEAATDGPRRISPPGARTEVLVVPTDEELAIARRVLSA